MLDGVGNKIGALGDKLGDLSERLNDADSLSDVLIGLFGTDDVLSLVADYAGDLIAQIIVRIPYDTLADLLGNVSSSS